MFPCTVKYSLPKFNILEWFLIGSGVHRFLQLPFQKSSALSNTVFTSLLLCIRFLQTLPWQHHESFCQLHPGQPLSLKTWIYESLTRQQYPAHRRNRGKQYSFTPYPWLPSLFPSPQNQHTDFDLLKLCYWRVTREDYGSSYKANGNYLHLSICYTLTGTEDLTWMVLFNWYKSIRQVFS